jgi:hypothetical protein
LSFDQGILPGALQLHDLGAMDEALPLVGHEVGLGGAPATQRRRPLPRPSEVEDLLTGLDHGAKDDARSRRRQLTDRDGDHQLVEQRHAPSGFAEGDQRLALAEPAERDQVLIAEARADRGDLVGGSIRGRVVALAAALKRVHDQQIPLLHAVVLNVVKQAPDAGEPAAAAGSFALLDQPAEGEPERTAGSACRFVPVKKSVIRARPDVGAVDLAADQVRRRR